MAERNPIQDWIKVTDHLILALERFDGAIESDPDIVKLRVKQAQLRKLLSK